MTDKLKGDLVKIGLSEQEAKVYLALLDHYKMAAKEVSQVTGIFRTQTYDVLKSLIKKGFCSELLDNVKYYVAIDPELALKTVILDFEKRSRLAESLSRQLHQTFLANSGERDVTNKLIEVIHSERVVKKRLRNYLQSTSRVLLSFNKPPYQIRYSDTEQGMLVSENKDIEHKAIFQIDNSNPKLTLEVAKKFQSRGEVVRLTEFLPMKMMIFDNLRVYYQLSAEQHNSGHDVSTFIQHPEITLTLINSFWVEWSKAHTIEQFEETLKEK